MNTIMIQYYPLFELYQALRTQLMEILVDEDLSFKPSGQNISLGALCRDIGDTEQAYIQSFKSFKLDFSYRNQDPGIEGSVEKLFAWFGQLDGELKAVVEGLSEEDIQNRKIDRGGGFELSPAIQLDVYKEALLIFYGKSSIYLKAMGKTLPEQWQQWIG